MKRKRLLSAYIDYLIIVFIVVVITFISIYINGFFNMDLCIFITMMLMLVKDLPFRNASIGKKVMKIEIRNKEGKIPSILTVILRNITLSISLFIFLELFLILIDKNRIGDYIFKTKIIEVSE